MRNFGIITGSINVPNLNLDYEETNAFTKMFTFHEIPKCIVDIVNRERTQIEQYLGKGFLASPVICFQNRPLPTWALNYDIYANVWHMDSHDGLRLLKIFVHLSDTSMEDGPLAYMTRKETKNNFSRFWHRWTFDNVRKGRPVAGIGENYFTSGRGGYLIINTGNCYHRATSPDEGRARTIMQITLYPSWRPSPSRIPFSTGDLKPQIST